MYTNQPKGLINHLKKLLILFLLLPAAVQLQAQQTAGKSGAAVWTNPLALTMFIIILVLLLVIVLLGNVLIVTAKLHFDKQQKSQQATITTTILFFLLTPVLSMAQEVTTVKPPVTYSGLSGSTFWFLVTVITVELLVIIVMALFVRSFLAKEKAATVVSVQLQQQEPLLLRWWNKLNRFKPAEQEADMDLGHDYDGIRELDNRLPPWWLYGFYVTIVIAGIYLWRYHIAETAPLSIKEYEIAMQHAEQEKAAYLSKAANNIDENTVTLLTEPSALDAGKNSFVQMCAACHGKMGEGGVGPNLTDAYWVNGGSIKDVFKTIKYGRPEKGMKSWQEDFSPVQIAQLASYIKSIQGTNPPNGKEKQGELYKEQTTAADSTAATQATVKQ